MEKERLSRWNCLCIVSDDKDFISLLRQAKKDADKEDAADDDNGGAAPCWSTVVVCNSKGFEGADVVLRWSDIKGDRGKESVVIKRGSS